MRFRNLLNQLKMILLNQHKHSLRNVQDDDHDWLVELHNDPEVLHNVTNPQKISIKHHLNWWNKIRNDNNQLRLIYTIDDNRVGFTKFYNIDQVNKNCVLGADIHKDYRGKGYAKCMWTLMLDVCFNKLDLYRVALTTAEYNEVGKQLYKKLGFVDEGKLKSSIYRNEKFYDQLCMYMLQSNWIPLFDTTSV